MYATAGISTNDVSIGRGHIYPPLKNPPHEHPSRQCRRCFAAASGAPNAFYSPVVNFLTIHPENILGGGLCPIRSIRILFYAPHVAAADVFRYMPRWFLFLFWMLLAGGRSVGGSVMITHFLNGGMLDSDAIWGAHIYWPMGPDTWPMGFRGGCT